MSIRLCAILLFLSLVAGCSNGPIRAPVTKEFPRSALKQKDTQDADRCRHSDTALRCVRIVAVYDGDSFFIDIPGIPAVLGKRIGVRVFGIDTPEVRSKDACEKRKGALAKSALQAILSEAVWVDIVDIQRDKYFRILGTVMADGKVVAEELLKQKLAFPYFGDKKPKRDWCR